MRTYLVSAFEQKTKTIVFKAPCPADNSAEAMWNAKHCLTAANPKIQIVVEEYFPETKKIGRAWCKLYT